MEELKERLRKSIQIESDLLVGCRNRMCVTDDERELFTLLHGAICHCGRLYDLNYKRIHDFGDSH